MLRSMTGFGRCLTETPHFTQQWEIKSVNNRHLDLKWRLPASVRSLESRLEKVVRAHAARGRIDISLVLQFGSGESPDPCFDGAQASAMLDALQHLASSRGDIYTPDYNRLLQLSMLWGDGSSEPDETLALNLEKGLEAALKDWNASRSAEGRALARDMNVRVLQMESWVDVIAERVPEIREERIATLRDRLAEILSGVNGTLDENRFLQEIVILTDKLDVTEELTRLRTHLERLRELLENGTDAGRRLDFTLQECFREINTCGNKTPDVHLSRLVVDFKNELEKCREQVQNLE